MVSSASPQRKVVGPYLGVHCEHALTLSQPRLSHRHRTHAPRPPPVRSPVSIPTASTLSTLPDADASLRPGSAPNPSDSPKQKPLPPGGGGIEGSILNVAAGVGARRERSEDRQEGQEEVGEKDQHGDRDGNGNRDGGRLPILTHERPRGAVLSEHKVCAILYQCFK